MTPTIRHSLLTLLLLPALAYADYVPFADRYGHTFDNERPWEESPLALPERVNLSEQPIELYVNQTYTNRAFVHQPITLADDGTLRYSLTIRTSSGSDNHSHEAIRCTDHHHKIFAYGNTSSPNWHIPRQSTWQHFDSYRAANDPVRARLMRIFCEDGQPLTAETANRLLQQQAGKR